MYETVQIQNMSPFATLTFIIIIVLIMMQLDIKTTFVLILALCAYIAIRPAPVPTPVPEPISMNALEPIVDVPAHAPTQHQYLGAIDAEMIDEYAEGYDECDELDGDELIAYQAQPRNDNTRVVKGIMNRRRDMDEYFREELTNEEDRQWWGRHDW